MMKAKRSAEHKMCKTANGRKRKVKISKTFHITTDFLRTYECMAGTKEDIQIINLQFYCRLTQIVHLREHFSIKTDDRKKNASLLSHVMYTFVLDNSHLKPTKKAK